MDGAAGGVELIERARGMRKDDLARTRRKRALADTLEEAAAEILFEESDVMADGGLAQPQRLRRSRATSTRVRRWARSIASRDITNRWDSNNSLDDCSSPRPS